MAENFLSPRSSVIGTQPSPPATTGEFQASVLTYYLLQRVLGNPVYFGDPTKYALKERIGPGTGESVRFPQYTLLPIPEGQLSADAIPSPTAFNSTYKDVSLQYYGMVTQVERRAIFQLGHDITKITIDLLGGAFMRTVYSLAYKALLTGNLSYGKMGSALTRATLATTDNITSDILADHIGWLRSIGVAPNSAASIKGNYVALIDPELAADLALDSTFVSYHSHQPAANAVLPKGFIKSWMGVDFVQSNFMPRYKNIAAPVAATSSQSGNITPSTNYDIVITGYNPLTGFEELISHKTAFGGGVSTTAIDVTLPDITLDIESNVKYRYFIYIGLANGTLRRAKTVKNSAGTVLLPSFAGGQTVTVTEEQSGNTSIQAAPPLFGAVASGKADRTRLCIILGNDSFGGVESEQYPYGDMKVVTSNPNVVIPGVFQLPVARSAAWMLDTAFSALRPSWIHIIEVAPKSAQAL